MDSSRYRANLAGWIRMPAASIAEWLPYAAVVDGGLASISREIELIR
jgi:hypothetical protein